MSGRGYHIYLSREDAKRLFAQPDDKSVRAFAEELLKSPKHRENNQILELGTVWDAIHRCLTDGDLDPQGGEFPLNQCILGGKQLFHGPDYDVVLIRPDVTPHVAEALAGVKREAFRETYFGLDPNSFGHAPNEEEFAQVWSVCQQIRWFFEDAAEQHTALLFVAER